MSRTGRTHDRMQHASSVGATAYLMCMRCALTARLRLKTPTAHLKIWLEEHRSRHCETRLPPDLDGEMQHQVVHLPVKVRRRGVDGCARAVFFRVATHLLAISSGPFKELPVESSFRSYIEHSILYGFYLSTSYQGDLSGSDYTPSL